MGLVIVYMLHIATLRSDYADRPWDPHGRYAGVSIARFRHWTLEVSHKQHTLGCVILFANRRVESVTTLAPDEWQDLQAAIQVTEALLEEAFAPRRVNWLQLGNKVHHLHFHGVPRYDRPRSWDGRLWVDPRPGMPVEWRTYESDRATVRRVAAVLRACATSLQTSSMKGDVLGY